MWGTGQHIQLQCDLCCTFSLHHRRWKCESARITKGLSVDKALWFYRTDCLKDEVYAALLFILSVMKEDSRNITWESFSFKHEGLFTACMKLKTVWSFLPWYEVTVEVSFFYIKEGGSLYCSSFKLCFIYYVNLMWEAVPPQVVLLNSHKVAFFSTTTGETAV